MPVSVGVHSLLAVTQVLEQSNRLKVHVLVQLDHIGLALHVPDRLHQSAVQQRLVKVFTQPRITGSHDGLGVIVVMKFYIVHRVGRWPNDEAQLIHIA